MIRLLRWFWLLLVLLSARAGVGPFVDEFGRAEFGVQGLGWSATQLRDGRLVFGFDGLAIFDGMRWRVESVPGTYAIRALDAAEDGGFWIGGVNELGYFTPEGSVFRYHSLTDRLPPGVRANLGDVWNVFANGADRAVFVSTSYVLRWLGDHFECDELRGAPRLAGFRQAGQILIGHRPSGLRAIRTHGFDPVLSPEQLHDAGVVWGGVTGGRPVFATTAGLRVLDRGQLTAFAPFIDRWINENVLTCASALADGRIAVGTLKGGTMVIEADGSDAHKLDLDADVATDAVHALFEDRERCLWVVCATGLFRVRTSIAIAAVRLPHPSGYPVQAIAPIADGALVASETGIWRVPGTQRGEAKSLHQVSGFHERILSLVRDGDDVLVAHRGGVSSVRADGSVALVRAVPGDVFTVARASDGRLYLALDRTVMQLAASGAALLPGTFPDVAETLIALPTGILVAGTYARGIATIGPPNADTFDLVAAVANEPGRSFIASSLRRLFVARGRKIAVSGEPGKPCRSLSLPADVVVKAMAAGIAGDAWLACYRLVPDRQGLPVIYHVELNNGALELSALRIDALHQIGGVTSLAAQDSKEGTVLWIGGEVALLRVLASQLPVVTAPIKPEFQLVTSLHSNAGEWQLPYTDNRFAVNILSPEPDRRPAMRVQTRLEGGDADWIYPQDQNNVTFAHLQSGHYRLHTRFVGADGMTSPIASIQFVVAQPWWLLPWALATEALAAVALVLGTIRLRFRSLRARAARLEKLIAQRTQQLALANQAKTEFVSNMSHELRNPLNGLVASVHALDEARLDPRHRRLLRTVRQCADLLDALIGDVLDMAEIESGSLKLRNQAYNPSELVSATASMMRPIAERKALQFRVTIDAGVPAMACGDPFRIQEVLLNLAGNAVKYTETGEITLTLRRSQTVEDQLEYSVQDHGPGIAETDRERLFIKFSRLPSSRERGIPGTGLGLAVCRELVQRMGGVIGVTSEVSVGSTFYFTIPIGDPANIHEGPSTQRRVKRARMALVVEDIDYNAEAMVAILEVFGCDADHVFTGTDALAALRQKAYDVVFIDCDLPDMTGPELAVAIAKAGFASLPRLIATTAYADDATRVRCRQAGIVEYLVKPVTREKLRAVLGKEVEQVVENDRDRVRIGPDGHDLRQLELLGDTATDQATAAARLGELLQADILKLRQACDAGNFSDARATAHRIVSHAHFVGAKGLAVVAGEMERCARAEPELVADLLPSVEAQAGKLVAVLESLKNQTQATPR